MLDLLFDLVSVYQKFNISLHLPVRVTNNSFSGYIMHAEELLSVETHSCWGAGARTEASCSGWMDEPKKEDYKGWGDEPKRKDYKGWGDEAAKEDYNG